MTKNRFNPKKYISEIINIFENFRKKLNDKLHELEKEENNLTLQKIKIDERLYQIECDTYSIREKLSNI